MYSGYALAFYDTVVSSDAALFCTMFDQFPRSYGRKMQPIRFFFCSKNAKKHKKCIFFALFFKKICVCIRATPSHFTTLLYLRTPPWSALCLTNSPEVTVAKCSPWPLFFLKKALFLRKIAFFLKNIWSCAFFVVPLHSLSKRKYDIRSRCYRLVA